MAELNFIETNSSKIIQTILEELENGVKEQLYPGDERRIFGETLAGVILTMYNTVNDACRQKMLRYARGEVLDALGQNRDVTRLSATKASTTLEFSIKEPFAQNIIIPEGIRVTGDLQRYFVTDKSAVLTAGTLSVRVPASAEESGEAYNGILSGGLNTIVDISSVALVDAVKNIETTSGGGDGEDDETFRERIREAENKLSTAGPAKAYKFHALSANPAVTDAAIVSETETVRKTLKVYAGHAFIGGEYIIPDSLVITGIPDAGYAVTYEDGLLDVELKSTYASRATIEISISKTMQGCVKIVPICANGEIPSEEILQDVLRACSADDVRPLTDRVIVAAPDVETYDIELTYYTDKADESQVIENVEGENGAISRYVYWQGSNLDQDINPDYLKKLILSPNWEADLTGATRVDIIKPVYKPLNKTTIAKFSGNLKVNHIVR